MKTTIFILLTALSINTYAQTDLHRIGQTPGGSSFHVNYDSITKHLFTGAGTSLWVYDMTDPADPVILAKRPFLGLINETILSDNVLFVAATHDGVYALDVDSDTLSIIDHYAVDGLGDIGAYDICLSGDTLFVADKFKVRRLKYTPGTGFTSIDPDFALFGSFCVAERGDLIAVGKQPSGTVEIYNKNNLIIPVSSWHNTNIRTVQHLQFSDSDDHVLYVCGGPTNLFSKSWFFALELSGDQLIAVDSFDVSGVVLLAQANIRDMDSRNDTLYIATTCAVDSSMGAPLSYIPVIDASGLPADNMNMISYLNPGLWHFDVSLMDGTPYLATASEWLGVALNDVTTSQPLDTLPLMETGGWTQKAKVRGNTLWVAHEGWGLAAYNTDSLKFANGYMTDSRILHLYSQLNHFFVGEFEFLNDTLLLLSNGDVYNLKPWQQGGKPQKAYQLNCLGVSLHNAFTNTGQRLVVGSEIVGFAQQMSLFNPFDPNGNSLKTIDLYNNPNSITVTGDTVFYGMKTGVSGTDIFLTASVIRDDDFILIDTILLPFNLSGLNAVSVENNVVAIGKGSIVAWYSWNGSEFTLLNSLFDPTMNAIDVVLENNYLYVADKMNGVKIFDIISGTLVGQYEQKTGWCGNFGYQDLCLDDDGLIYLSDFNAGVIMIERFDQTLGTNDHKIPPDTVEENILVYPNPSSSFFTVEFDNPENVDYTISIYNSLGQKVMSIDNITTEKQTIETGTFKRGIYFIELKNGNHRYKIKKVVIE